MMILLLLFLCPTLQGQTLSMLLDKVDQNKTQLFNITREDWNKTITSKRKCLISDQGRRFVAAICYGKDGSLVKLKLLPGRVDNRMQISFLKSGDLYIGVANCVTTDNTGDTIKEDDNFPFPSSAFRSVQLSSFKNIYVYNPKNNSLYVLSYEEHNEHNDIDNTSPDTLFDADYSMRQLWAHIKAVYYFKADLLGEQKYIEPVCAIGVFDLEPARFQYAEALRLIPIAYKGAPADDYFAIKKHFLRDSALVTNAYFVDAAHKTTYETDVPMDSLLQLDLDQLNDKNILRTQVPGNALRRGKYVIKFPVNFDILDVGRGNGFSSRTGFMW